VANSGRFARSLGLLLGPGSAFGHFLAFSDWLWRATGKTHEFAYEKLVDLLHDHLTTVRGLAAGPVRAALRADYQASGARGSPQSLAELPGHMAGAQAAAPDSRRAERQLRHLGQHREDIKHAAAAA
ncbi:MAG: B12-binding domain-containing radical SAM protein, partial [Polaromonas sp.]|nr:B12-binding domain-containing radical SAM protein [Polaromonas sp.]